MAIEGEDRVGKDGLIKTIYDDDEVDDYSDESDPEINVSKIPFYIHWLDVALNKPRFRSSSRPSANSKKTQTSTQTSSLCPRSAITTRALGTTCPST